MMQVNEGPIAQRLVRLFAFPVMMVIIMLGSYIPAMRAPAPHDVQIAIVNPPAFAAAVVEAYQSDLDGEFDFVMLPDAATARDAIEDRSVAAAIVFAPDPNDLEVGSAYLSVPPPAANQEPDAVAYVAGAAGTMRASMSLIPLQDLAAELGAPLVVRDLAVLDPDDGAGVGSMFFTMAMTLAGFLSIITVVANLPELFRLATLAGTLSGFGLVISVLVWFLSDVVIGAVQGPVIPIIFTGVLTVTAVGFATAAVTRLIGPISVLFALFVFVALGMTASGVGVPIEYTGGIYPSLHEVLPFPAAAGAVQSLAYFDGDEVWRAWLVLAIWLVVGAVSLELINRRKGIPDLHLPEPGPEGAANPVPSPVA